MNLQHQNLIVPVLVVLMVFLFFGSNESRQTNHQLRRNAQTLRNIDRHARETAKSVEAMCRDAVTPPSAC